MIKLLLNLLGLVFLIVGVLLFWTPIPIGAVLALVGLALLVANSSRVRGWVAGWRSDHRKFDKWIRKAGRHTPRPAERILMMTDPECSPAADIRLCDHCGCECIFELEVRLAGQVFHFDCFDCAIDRLAPVCQRCGRKFTEPALQGDAGELYCSLACRKMQCDAGPVLS